jgi:hypothetical protein
MYKNKYSDIHSLTELRFVRRYLAGEIDRYEKKIRNDYSVFKTSFSVAGSIFSILGKIPRCGVIFNNLTSLYVFISKIAPLLRKHRGDS